MMDDDENSKVGYGNPPKHARFRPGVSGNPKGRPKGTRNFGTDLEDILKARVKITEDGQSKSVSSQRAALMRLREKALKGDPRALDRLLSMAAEHSAEKEARSTERQHSASEEDILRRFTADVLRNPAAFGKSGAEGDGSDAD